MPSAITVAGQDVKTLEFISSLVASNSASVSFTGLSSTYFTYKLIVSGYLPATDATSLIFKTSANNGASYDAGASDYSWIRYTAVQNTTPNNSTTGDEADTGIILTTNIGSAPTATCDFEITLINPSATIYTSMLWDGMFTNSILQQRNVNGSGTRLSSAAVNAIELTSSSGNIATGTFKLYGIRD